MIKSTPHSFPQTLHPHWKAAAARKGFALIGRTRDRYHLLLRCQVCGETHTSRRNVVIDHQPLCPNCTEARWKADARAAGLQWLRRDPMDRHHGFYRAACGHKIRRQFELVQRVANGACNIRCDLCHIRKEQTEAIDRGWQMVGDDPRDNPNYRLYTHQSCGYTQRVARANMQTGRFDCSACGQGWASAPSFLYAMRFALGNGAKLVKLGFSRDPDSRLRHQLLRRRDVEAAILRTVQMPTGHAALCQEKRMHSNLRAMHPDQIIPPSIYADTLRVRSELYCASLTDEILSMLNTIDAENAS